MAKLKVQGEPSENCESIEDIVEELTKIIKKPLRFDENSDDKIPLDCDVGKVIKIFIIQKCHYKIHSKFFRYF